MRWNAPDEPGWIADLREAAAAVRNHRDAQTNRGRGLAWLMADLGVLLETTATRIEVILLEERHRLRPHPRRDGAGR